MRKRIVPFLLALILVIGVLTVPAQAAGSLSNFTRVNTYKTGQFNDVSTQWFATYVQAAYEYGLMDGTAAKTFAPGSNLTIASAIKLAACLHSIYSTGRAEFSGGSPWYQPYVDYALSNEIIAAPFADYAANATRADFAKIFAGALPLEALNAVNRIDDNAIPDVRLGDDCGPAVYLLYRAGILTGDASGAFNPASFIQRSEVAAIAVRMASAEYRQSLTLTVKELSSTEIAAKCMPAVFYIEVYDKNNVYIGSGSGFFISSSGMAVTNYHVIKGAHYAKIRTTENKIYEVTGVYDYSKKTDLALIQVRGDNFPYLSVGSSDTLSTGATVYAIGYPLGINETITQGIISNANHVVNNKPYIMINASISPGSSGGALVSATGAVIGITSATYRDAQNLNLAVPVSKLSELDKLVSTPLYALPDDSKASLSFAPPSVTVAKGDTVKVVITEASGNLNYDLAYSLSNEAIVSVDFGPWTDIYTTSVDITGLKPGTVKLTISVVNDDAVITSSVINITVT